MSKLAERLRERQARLGCAREKMEERLGRKLEAESNPLCIEAADALDACERALREFAAFADALNEQVPGDIAIGIYADGAMRFGPSGGATVASLRNAREALAKLDAAR